MLISSGPGSMSPWISDLLRSWYEHRRRISSKILLTRDNFICRDCSSLGVVPALTCIGTVTTSLPELQSEIEPHSLWSE